MNGPGETISGRWTPEALKRRLRLEERKARKDLWLEARGPTSWLCEARWIDAAVGIVGLRKYGHGRMLDLAARTDEIFAPSLPEPFDGFRILHLSDAHFDLEPKLAEIATGLVASLDYDICLFTGDFRDHLSPSGIEGVRLAAKFLRDLGRPVYACLGNHDLASDVPVVEECGARVLVNENVFIERGGKRIAVCGVDDPGFFKTDDFAAAFRGVAADDFAILLAHDPCAYKKAMKAGASVMLCGHTHGGQICLPGGWAPTTHSSCPRRMVAGMWRCGGMAGYTSGGIGASRVAARFFSRGEAAIHILRRAPK